MAGSASSLRRRSSSSHSLSLNGPSPSRTRRSRFTHQRAIVHAQPPSHPRDRPAGLRHEPDRALPKLPIETSACSDALRAPASRAVRQDRVALRRPRDLKRALPLRCLLPHRSRRRPYRHYAPCTGWDSSCGCRGGRDLGDTVPGWSTCSTKWTMIDVQHDYRHARKRYRV
jgi:hypothetical protein